MAKTLEKRVRAVKLELFIHTYADGKVKIEATLNHKCKTSRDAKELIKQYVNLNTVEESKVKA